MTVLQGVLASAGLMAVLMGLIWRMFVHFDAKNGQAHAAITENIKAVDDRAERRSEAHGAALEAMTERMHAIAANVQAVDDRAERRSEAHGAVLEAQRATLESIARDVSFLAGRQAERDQHKPNALAEAWRITSRSSCTAVVMLVVSLAFSVTSALAQSSDASSSDSPMLQNPLSEDWPMRGRTPDGWGYSPLDQINRNNVAQLQIVWSRGFGPNFRQEAPSFWQWASSFQQGTSPRVYDGTMYLFTSDGVQAVDAATGDIRWRYGVIRESNDSNDFDLVIHHHRTSDASESSYVVALDEASGGPVFALDTVDGRYVWPTTDERDTGSTLALGEVVDVANSTLGSCPPRFRANSREARTYSPITGYCMTTNGGTVQAISAETNTAAWEYEQETAMGRLAATGGGLVFGGDHGGRFRAFDHETGEVIWETDLGAPITHSPITYAVGGRQYVAIFTDSDVLLAFSLSLLGDDALNTDAACPLSKSHSMNRPLELYRDNPRPYWFFPFILGGVEQVDVIYPEGPVIICEAVHRSTWSKRSLWLHIVAGSKRGWVDVGLYDSLEDFLRH